jgi:hypothetical protein
MACKYHFIRVETTPEIGGTLTSKQPYCAAHRDDIVGWERGCKETPPNGPCWQDRPKDSPDKPKT